MRAPIPDSLRLVFDFTELEDRVKGWIDEHWDHAFLANSRDTELISGLAPTAKGRLYQFEGETPSCEVMSPELCKKVRELCGVAPDMVRQWESSDHHAEYRESG